MLFLKSFSVILDRFTKYTFQLFEACVLTHSVPLFQQAALRTDILFSQQHRSNIKQREEAVKRRNKKMFTVYHQCRGDLVACVQTNLINYSNLGGGRLASQILKCQCLDLPHCQLRVRKQASASKTGM